MKTSLIVLIYFLKTLNTSLIDRNKKFIRKLQSEITVDDNVWSILLYLFIFLLITFLSLLVIIGCIYYHCFKPEKELTLRSTELAQMETTRNIFDINEIKSSKLVEKQVKDNKDSIRHLGHNEKTLRYQLKDYNLKIKAKDEIHSKESSSESQTEKTVTETHLPFKKLSTKSEDSKKEIKLVRNTKTKPKK